MSQALPAISLIWAMARNRAIGIDNRLPWHLPADLKRFRNLTTGHHIVMGRKTFESFPKPLPNRTHVIITSDREYRAPAGCLVAHSIDAALALAQSDSEIFVIGGASLYAQTLPRAHRLYMTLIDTVVEGDAFFPAFDMGEWKETAHEVFARDDQNPYSFSFVTLERSAG